VADTGSGLPPEILNRIFDPLFTTKAPGKGLSSYALVQQAGGAIAVESKVGAGTQFHIMLPRSAAAPADAEKDGERVKEFACDETILVVEDDPDVLTTMVAFFGKCGSLVISAPNGEDGLKGVEIYGDHIDLVLSDIVMPRLNGHELPKVLRARPPEDQGSAHERLRRGLDANVEIPEILYKLPLDRTSSPHLPIPGRLICGLPVPASVGRDDRMGALAKAY
jgi:two-component system cell cycle sensor histidine kinase/response regulator CckA